MGQDEKDTQAQRSRPSAERIARRVAVKQELARLVDAFDSIDAATVLAVIGAVGAAAVLALIYLSFV